MMRIPERPDFHQPRKIPNLLNSTGSPGHSGSPGYSGGHGQLIDHAQAGGQMKAPGNAQASGQMKAQGNAQANPFGSGHSGPVAQQSEAVWQHQATADALHDMQLWRAATDKWQADYKQTRTGQAALGAVAEAQAFHDEQLSALSEKYRGDPLSMLYLHDAGSRLGRRSQNIMQAYAQAEKERFTRSALEAEEQELYRLAASPDSTDEERKAAFADYVSMSRNLSRGESQKTLEPRLEALSKDLTVSKLNADFDRLLEQDPEQAARLIRMAQGKEEHSAQTTQGGTASEQSGAGEADGAYTDQTASQQIIKSTLLSGEKSAVPQMDTLLGNPVGQGANGSVQSVGQGENGSAQAGNQPDSQSANQSDNRGMAGSAQATGQDLTGQGKDAAKAAEGDGESSSQDSETARLRALADEYTKNIPADHLQIMASRAESAQNSRLRRDEEQTVSVFENIDETMLRAVDSGDFSAVLNMEKKLVSLGQEAAADEIKAVREIMVHIKPALEASRFEGPTRQFQIIQELCECMTVQGLENNPALKTVQALAEQSVLEQYRRFSLDPVSYVSSHHLLSEPGLSQEEFCQKNGLSNEQYLTKLLKVQSEMTTDGSVLPRLLTMPKAAELKDQYEAMQEAQQKAEFLQQLAKDYGKYGTTVMMEAGIPNGMAVFAEILPGMAQSEIARLVKATETSLDSHNLSDSHKEEIRQRVAASPLVSRLQNMQTIMTGGADADAGQNQGDTVNTPFGRAMQAITQAMENFVALGGNLDALERRILADGNVARVILNISEMGTTPGSKVDHLFTEFKQSMSKSLWAWAHESGFNGREMDGYRVQMPKHPSGLAHMHLPLEERLISNELYQYLNHGREMPLEDPVLQKELEGLMGHKIFYDTAEEFEKSSHYRPGIKWYPGMTIAAGEMLAYELDADQMRKALIAINEELGGWAYKVLGVAAGLGAEATNPLNYIPAGIGFKAARGL